MPSRTAKGTAIARRVGGFRTVIETAETNMSRWAEEQNVFTRYLPFAIVFGCTDKWAKAFEGLQQMPPGHDLVSVEPAVRLRGLQPGDGRLLGDDRRHDRLHTEWFGIEWVRGGG